MNLRLTNSTHSLKNGMRVHIVPYSGIKSVSIRAWVFVGSACENTEISGISHFLEHMMFRGNKILGTGNEMNLKIEEIGGDLNAATSFDQTEYWLDFHVDFLEKGIRRFCQFLRSPLFEQFETERSIIIEEILSDYNEEKILIDTDTIVSKSLWGDQSIGLPIGGTLSSIKNLSIKDLKSWYQEYYNPGNVILGITGDVKEEEILQIIEDEFPESEFSETLKYKLPITDPQKGKQILFVHEKDPQFNLHWAFPFEELNPRKRVILQLIGRVLDDGSTSILQRQIREERGLVYDISAQMSFYETGGALNIQSLVSVSKFRELIQLLTDLMGKRSKEGFSQESIQHAKLRFKVYLDCVNDTAYGSLNEQLGPVLQPALLRISEMLNLIDEISEQEIIATLEALIDQKSTCFVLVGPVTDEIKEFVQIRLNPWVQ